VSAPPAVKAAVLAGGPDEAGAPLRAALADVDLVVAADGGVALADALGLTPDLWVGDFDSTSDEQRGAHPALPRLEYPRDKDELDLDVAAQPLANPGARELVLAGVFGGRLDQTLAALLIGARLRREGVDVRLFGGPHEVRPLVAGDSVELTLPDATLFSLLALDGDAVVDVLGARFELASARLAFGVGLGVSNQASATPGLPGGPRITVRSGTVAVVVEWGEALP
jgi:thiamine pyrophosphokinase